MAEIWETLRWVVGSAALITGAICVLIGALGMWRLGDVYQRMHAVGVIDTGGAGLILLGLILVSPDWGVGIRLALIGGLLVFTSPTATHAIARAARFSGIDPEEGERQ